MNKKNSVKYYTIIIIIWVIFIILMSQAVLMRIIDTDTYILYGFVVLYILYVYVQLFK
jgi:hypothetical protein